MDDLNDESSPLASSSSTDLEKANLKRDVERLKLQLEEEKSNSKQAAEYGLSLLEDFKKLQSRNFELEGEIETYKAELETTNAQLSKVKHTKKIEDAKELNLEDSWMIESANREEKLTQHLNTVELELTKNKQELERVYNEHEKLSNSHQELTLQCEQLKDQLIKQKNEIKSLKERENRLLVDNTELDGENVQLQEQIARLKEDLVELDTVRHENKALEEKLDTLQSQILELTTLKRIVEKQLEESLNSFREEREHKYQKKRQSQERREKQSLRELNDIAKDLDTAWHPNKFLNDISSDDDDIEEDDMDSSNKPADLDLNNVNNNNPKGSLFDEIVLLEKKVEDINKHKNQLENELNEFKLDLNLIINNIQNLNKSLNDTTNKETSSNTIVINNNSNETKENLVMNDDEQAKLGKVAVGYIESFKKDFEKLVLTKLSLFNGSQEDAISKKMELLELDSSFVNDSLVIFILYF